MDEEGETIKYLRDEDEKEYDAHKKLNLSSNVIFFKAHAGIGLCKSWKWKWN